MIKMKIKTVFLSLVIVVCVCSGNRAFGQASQGYDLWLGYDEISNKQLLREYQQATSAIYFQHEGAITKTAHDELSTGLSKMLDRTPNFSEAISSTSTMIIAKKAHLDKDILPTVENQFDAIGAEGFIIKTVPYQGRTILLLTANGDIGILYGVARVY